MFEQKAHQVSVLEALAALAATPKPFTTVFSHGSLALEIYRPPPVDPQTPHDRDELYVVITGHGWFARAGTRVRFAPGDVLFVAAGVEHRFEDYSADFLTWVIFYGPRGGERPDAVATKRGEPAP